MKDSGIEWIGEIPESSAVCSVKNAYLIILGKMVAEKSSSEHDVERKYFSAINVHNDGVDDSVEKLMWFSPFEWSQYRVKRGDLLVVEGGAGAGGAGIYNGSEDEYGVQNSIFIARYKAGADNRFLMYWLHAFAQSFYVPYITNLATIPHFTKTKLMNMPFIQHHPHEERAISSYLDKQTHRIDKLIEAKQSLINELAGYKASVIYEYVTGKKEVP